MTRKKIIFVIVEGPSDETALSAILDQIYDRNAVYLYVTRCDITTEKGTTPSNIINKVAATIKQYAANYHFNNKIHFQEIIHIVDMDGAYIPDENIAEDASATKTMYDLNEIRTSDLQGIVQRNQQKKANLNKLCGCKEIWSVPYRVFYMSCNLDHVLYNKLNSTDTEKENDSFAFAKKYKSDIPGFLVFVSESDFSVVTEYRESWEYIKQGLHSLQRHTNLGLCFIGNENKAE